VSESARTDELRSARLLLGDAGIGEEERVRAAVRSRRFPPAPLRFAARVRRKLGGLEYEPAVAAPMQAARRAVLGDDALAPPRFLVRVDEFPHYQAWDDPGRYGTERYARFHEIMAGAGVPYLIAVLARVSRAPLDPNETAWRDLDEGERAMLDRLGGEGVTFALHGLDHRTRFESPRRHSELCGLDAPATERLIDTALARLELLGIAPEVFVTPYNRFDAGQYPLLASRFRVVCGGPESVGLVGFQRTPLWRGQAVYLPSYQPLYGHAREVLPAARRLIDAQVGLWAPIVLHWGWEADEDWQALERLAEQLSGYAADWQDFLAAVGASEDAGAVHTRPYAERRDEPSSPRG
jgi:hypothetical protein